MPARFVNPGSESRRVHTSVSAGSLSLPLFLAALLMLVMFAFSAVVHAQAPPPQDPSQFDMTGFIQAATLDANCVNDPLCGGTITVNNQVIRVPRNTILQMPATALSWQEVFATAPAPYGLITPNGPQSGMAMRDIPAPLGTYEAGVIGNRVGNTYIAGLIFLSQHSLQSGQGFINFIDYTTGTFEVGGTIGVQNTGEKLKINDPIGRFGRASSPDPRFTIDEDNPTIRSETGYPMCMPRTAPSLIVGAPETDPLCPQANRPKDGTSPSGYLMIFTMPPVAGVIPGGPDSRRFAPFEVGDYVTWSGIMLSDGSFAAHSVIGNVGLFTASGDNPAYMAVEVMLLGVGGTTVAGGGGAGGAEATARTRFEGFTTDASRNIQLYGLDVDPCTGAEGERDWGTIDVDPGPPNGAVLGRWRFRPPSKVLTGPAAGTFLPATREMRAAFVGTAVDHQNQQKDFGNGLIAGQYTTPIAEFLFPENAGTGNPIVPNNFEDMPFLALGSGPIGGEGTSTPTVGQLNPWPLGFQQPLTPPVCAAPGVPVANAGPDQSVASGSPVALNGSGSTDPSGAALTYLWSQVSGPPVVLTTNPASALATFTAPVVQPGAAAKLVFQLIVRNGAGQVSAADTVTITVNPIVADVVTISLVEYRTGKQRLTVDASSTASGAVPPAQLTMQAFDANGKAQGVPQNMPFIGGGIYEVILVGAPQPATVKVTSDHGGSTTSGITRLRN